MNAAEKLLATTAVTIDKSQFDVQIQCSNSDDATTIFEWLTELAERLARKNAPARKQFSVGDSVEVISARGKGRTGKVRSTFGDGVSGGQFVFVDGPYVAYWFHETELKHVT
jgi:hypothetical protein